MHHIKMESWQNAHISRNLAKLLSLTNCNVLLLAELKANNLFSEVDVEEINAERTNHGKANMLYTILQTRSNYYFHLIRALLLTKQTGASEILISILNDRIRNLQFVFQGNIQKIQQLLSRNQIESIIEWLKIFVSPEECVTIHENILKNPTLQLLRDTIPKPTSNYIPRYLIRRLVVKPEVIEKCCSDVFVFKKIHRLLLRSFVKSGGIELSTHQLLAKEITARFILLDCDTDWERICASVKTPVHLIRYEESTRTFVLEATSGRSNELYQSLKQQDKSDCQLLSEDSFLDTISTENTQKVCICDSPGMGKSVLLANIARKTQQRWPEKVVAYMELRCLTLPDQPEIDAILALLLNITTSKLASRILQELLPRMDFELELFLDGLDEVKHEYLDRTITFLVKLLKQIPGMKMYVTSRNVARVQLEKALGVIAYDIQPFNDQTQRIYLTKHWAQHSPCSDTNKLTEYADFCLRSVQGSLKESEKEITGVPLLCWLLANVYNEKATIFADKSRQVFLKLTPKFADSLSDVYEQFLARQLGRTKCNFSCMEKTKVHRNVQCESTCLIKNFHVWQALLLVFPNIAKELSQHITALNVLNYQQILSPGLLDSDKNNQTFTFLHRTFAEYMVAEYFANSILKSSQISMKNNIHISTVQRLLFNEIFSPGERVEIWEAGDIFQHFTLRENVVAYFLNDILTKTHTEIQLFTNIIVSPLDRIFVSAFEGCLFGDYKTLLNGLMKTAQNYLESCSWLYKLYYNSATVKQSKENTTYNVLRVAAKYSNAKTLHHIFKFFTDVIGINLSKVLELDTSPLPIQFAIKRANYEVVQCFVENMSLQNKSLLHHCFRGTYFENDELVERKLDIAQLLISSCPDLQNELKKFGLSSEKNPFLVWDIHLEAIRFLVERVANVFIANDKGETVFYCAADYTSYKHILKCKKHLYDELNAQHWFLDHVQGMKFFGFVISKQKYYTDRTILRLMHSFAGSVQAKDLIQQHLNELERNNYNQSVP